MEVFQGAQFVRLRCRVRRSKYLAADDDGWGIVLSGQRGAHNTVWAVEHYVPGAAGGGASSVSVSAPAPASTPPPPSRGPVASTPPLPARGLSASTTLPPARGSAAAAGVSASSPAPPPRAAAAADATGASPAASPAPPARASAVGAGGGDEQEGAGPFVLLRGAYGRYLLATDHQASTGPSHGVYAVQNGDHSHHPTPPGMLWQALRRRGSFVLRNSTGRYLRANGKYLRWRNAVTVAGDTASAMMQWFVEVVPRRLDRPTLVDPPPQLIHRGRLPATEGEVTRTIRYVRADGRGNFREQDWRTIRVSTNSLLHLRMVLANRMGHNRDALHTTICVRAGSAARLSPLLIDFPIGNDRIDVVVLSHGTPVDNGLVYPDVDAQ